MPAESATEADDRTTPAAQASHHPCGRSPRPGFTTGHHGGASNDIVEQLELVVSELATNAMQYNVADTLTITVDSDGEGWTIDVSNADGLFDIGAPSLPLPSALSGRGLFLVDAVMDRVELVDVDGRLHVRCVKFAG